MNISKWFNRTEKILTDNSPAILMACGIIGTVTTAILTGKASFKAAEVLSYDPDADTREQIKMVWKLYIPPTVTGIATIGAIYGSHHISTRRAAAVAAAYSISERAFAEYKDKVIEKIGENKEQKIRDEIAQDRVNNDPYSGKEVIIASGEVLCYESFTGRYFKSDVETIKKAQNDTNYQILHDNYASLTDFYNRVGLPRTALSDDMGWNLDRHLEIEFSTTLSEDSRPCIAINFLVSPIRGYSRIH